MVIGIKFFPSNRASSYWIRDFKLSDIIQKMTYIYFFLFHLNQFVLSGLIGTIFFPSNRASSYWIRDFKLPDINVFPSNRASSYWIRDFKLSDIIQQK